MSAGLFFERIRAPTRKVKNKQNAEQASVTFLVGAVGAQQPLLEITRRPRKIALLQVPEYFCMLMSLNAPPCMLMPLNEPPCMLMPLNEPPCMRRLLNEPPCMLVSLNEPPCMLMSLK